MYGQTSSLIGEPSVNCRDMTCKQIAGPWQGVEVKMKNWPAQLPRLGTPSL
jgi:hypothetical protein